MSRAVEELRWWLASTQSGSHSINHLSRWYLFLQVPPPVARHQRPNKEYEPRRYRARRLPHLGKPAYQWAINVYRSWSRRLCAFSTRARAHESNNGVCAIPNTCRDEWPCCQGSVEIILLQEIHNSRRQLARSRLVKVQGHYKRTTYFITPRCIARSGKKPRTREIWNRFLRRARKFGRLK